MESKNVKVYFENIFNDLARQNTNNHKDYISKYTFRKLFNIPILITSRLYQFLCKSESKNLTHDIFIKGMSRLISADQLTKQLIVFYLMDFTGGAKIREKYLKVFYHITNFTNINIQDYFSDKLYITKSDLTKVGNLFEMVFK
jgi:hypothetical protein